MGVRCLVLVLFLWACRHDSGSGELALEVGPIATAPRSAPGTQPVVPARGPLALAVTPDGTKAYVAYERDHVLTVIDAENDRVLREIEIGGGQQRSEEHVSLAVDPEGRHAFLVDPRRRELLVVDVASDTLMPSIAVPPGSRRMAFDFDGGTRRIYVTNARDDTVLRFLEEPPGAFLPVPALALTGHRPDALVVLPDGRLVVGNHQTRDLELLDPGLPPASASVLRSALDRRPIDLVLSGSRLLMTTFVPTPGPAGPSDGRNEVFEITPSTLAVVAVHLVDVGTDYARLVAGPQHVVVVASGSGSALVIDGDTLALQQRVELAPGQPLAVPVDLAFVPGPGAGPSQKLYVLEHFRETVRPIDLSGPPFQLAPEIVLSRTGAARVPGQDLPLVDEGEWLFKSVAFFNGTAASPNPVTCATCHPQGGSDGARHLANLRQAAPLFHAGETAPFGANGNGPSLLGFTQAAFTAHGVLGGTIPFGAAQRVQHFAAGLRPPLNPYRESDGSLSPQAQAGRLVFEQASCALCHASELFLPVPPVPRTIPAGVGTGLAPANVPTLLGLWATGPYLHDHSAATLRDVLLQNAFDQHGVTSLLTVLEQDALLAYLESL